MGEQYTLEQVIEMTVNILQGIRPPMELFDEIAVPVKQSISNLYECLAAIRSTKEEKDGNANAE